MLTHELVLGVSLALMLVLAHLHVALGKEALLLSLAGSLARSLIPSLVGALTLHVAVALLGMPAPHHEPSLLGVVAGVPLVRVRPALPLWVLGHLLVLGRLRILRAFLVLGTLVSVVLRSLVDLVLRAVHAHLLGRRHLVHALGLKGGLVHLLVGHSRASMALRHAHGLALVSCLRQLRGRGLLVASLLALLVFVFLLVLLLTLLELHLLHHHHLLHHLGVHSAHHHLLHHLLLEHVLLHLLLLQLLLRQLVVRLRAVKF